MICGVGVDLVSVKRIDDVILRHGDRFLNRLFSSLELAVCNGDSARIAARFAGKEAFVKAVGGWHGMQWRDISFGRNGGGAPYLVRTKPVDRALALSHATTVWVTFSHEKSMAVATVIAERS